MLKNRFKVKYYERLSLGGEGKPPFRGNEAVHPGTLHIPAVHLGARG